MPESSLISPTAHYTGQVWVRNGLSHPALATLEGRVMFAALEPAMLAGRLIGAPTLEPYLLARHRLIDAQLADAIDAGRVSQVLELAAGMSPRGWRLSGRYGAELLYVEADLPAMARRKAGALERIGPLGAEHRVESVDATRPGGPGSLEELLGRLDPARGTAVITEGLLNYLPEPAIRELWQRIAAALRRFPTGLYLSDLIPGSAAGQLAGLLSAGVARLLPGAPGARFSDAAGVEAALIAAGFSTATLADAGVPLAYVINARA